MPITTPLERETYVVVSTAHLAPATAKRLSHLPIICDETEYRFRIPLKPALAQKAVVPPELAALLAAVAAAAPDAYGVMIDADGPIVPGLSTFDW